MLPCRDSGIGMTREQLLSNLGTIARSGTRKFMEAVKESKGDANLIGQFGVGFYSAFLVADRVTVYTKSHEEDQQWVWESSVGSHQYTIKEDDSGDKMARGTRVVLHLKVCEDEVLGWQSSKRETPADAVVVAGAAIQCAGQLGINSRMTRECCVTACRRMLLSLLTPFVLLS